MTPWRWELVGRDRYERQMTLGGRCEANTLAMLLHEIAADVQTEANHTLDPKQGITVELTIDSIVPVPE